MRLVKVTDARTGKLKRYEDEQGRAIAIVKNGKLVMTTRGAELNLVLREGKLHEISSTYPVT